MNIREAAAKFKTDEDCPTYLEQMRWPHGKVRCPECGTDKPVRLERKATSRNKRGWFYLCSEKTCYHWFPLHDVIICERKAENTSEN